MADEYVTKSELLQAITSLSSEISQLLEDVEILRPETSSYITTEEMTQAVTNAIDTWGNLLMDILEELTRLTDEINGEVVYDNLVNKLQYLQETKRLIKNKIQQFSEMPDNTRFRDYPNYISGGGGVSGTIDITENGLYDVAQYENANVNIPTHMHVFNLTGVNRNDFPYSISMSVESE